jgi:ribose 5-phosphate isomerase RpiB
MRVGITTDHGEFGMKVELVAHLRGAVCANKVTGLRAALIHDHFSAQLGVEDVSGTLITTATATICKRAACTWMCLPGTPPSSPSLGDLDVRLSY